MQAYALARPAIRFRLHVLKAKNKKGDFVYAPKANSNVEDAVLKVFGKDCALQCDWTAIESDDFEIHAVLPKPTAIGAKIANQGDFISVDSRPVSSSCGTMKKIVTMFKERLRRSSPGLATVKDPFFCLNIICPPDSYEPNIGPGKDDIMFDNGDVVLSVVDKLLIPYYPEATCKVDDSSALEPDQARLQQVVESTSHVQSPVPVCEDEDDYAPEVIGEEEVVAPRSDQPRWRSSMYGIREDDLEHLQENQPPAVEKEEGSRAAAVHNPWTIARMNAPVKAKTFVSTGQLLNSAKNYGEESLRPSSPAPFVSPRRASPIELLTPQTSSRMNRPRVPLDEKLEQSIGHLDRVHHEETVLSDHGSEPRAQRDQGQSSDRHFGTNHISHQPSNVQQLDEFTIRTPNQVAQAPRSKRAASAPSQPHFASPAPRRSQRKQQPRTDDSFDNGLKYTWFGQPMQGSDPVQPPHQKTRRKEHEVSLFPSDMSSRSSRTILPAAEGMMNDRLTSENNTDIRDFVEQNRLGRIADGQGRQSFMSDVQNGTPLQSRSRASSAEPQSRPYNTTYAYPSSHRPLSVGSERSSLLPKRSNGIHSARDLHHDQSSANSRDMAAYFKSHQDREVKSSSPMRRQEPRTAPAHQATPRFRPQRRRTADGVQRTKLSKPPLERIPKGFHIQNLLLSIEIGIASIVYSSRKLDMTRNSLEWGYAADDDYKTFAEPVTERKIMNWVVKLDDVLDELFERLPGADTRTFMYEAIQRGLDARMGDGGMGGVEGVDVLRTGEIVVQDAQPVVLKKEDEMDGFDMSQFIDMDMREIEDDDEVCEVRSEFGDGIEDVMLLDL